MQPAMRWVTRGIYVKTIAPGDRVSYGGTFEATRPTVVMTLPVGYADGYRRGISGIVHMLKSGARWRDCPPEFGPYTTVYNRFNRWSRQGLWLQMFEALTGHTGIYGAAIDATHVRAHRSAAGAKGGPSSKP